MQILRLILVFIWVMVSSAAGALLGLIFFRNPSLVQKVGHVFGGGILKILGLRVEVQGKEILSQHSPAVFIGNHQSAVDIAVFSWLIPPKTVAVGKKELLRIPVFGLLFYATGNLLIDRKNRTQAVGEFVKFRERIHREGLSIIIFPEGTRNHHPENGLLSFKRGAFHLAQDAQLPLIAVVCGPMDGIIQGKRKQLVIKVLPPRAIAKDLTSLQVSEFIKEMRQEMTHEADLLRQLS